MLDRFARKWTLPDYPPDPVEESELAEVEARLGLRLPQEYREAVLRVGLPQPTLALLNAIVVRKLPLNDVGEFCAPGELIDQALDWQAVGLPRELLPIALDSAGSMFCFDCETLRAGDPAGQAVWFFDHEFGTAEIIAPSFTAWIAAFCEVEPVPDTALD